MSGTKYKGTALYVDWLPSTGGTIVLTAESRTFETTESANTIDVTVRSDTAKSFLTDFPAISVKMAGLDTSGTATGGTAAQNWERLNIGDSGTLRWGPEGTATGYRKKTMPGIVKDKNMASPYDGAVTWDIGWDSQGGTVATATW